MRSPAHLAACSARPGTRVPLTAALLAAALTGIGSVGAPAFAAVPQQRQGCAPDAAYSYGDIGESHLQGPPYSQGGPGQRLSIELTAGMAVSAILTGAASADLSAIVAGARTEVSASLGVTLTASLTYGDSWTVPSDVQEGYLAVGAASELMHWSYGEYNGACKWVVTESGSLNAPYHLPAFWAWTS
jgi:hypothetical protein